MVREIKDKIRDLNIRTKGLRENANICSYSKAMELRVIKEKNEQKIDFYKGLLSAISKENEKSVKQ